MEGRTEAGLSAEVQVQMEVFMEELVGKEEDMAAGELLLDNKEREVHQQPATKDGGEGGGGLPGGAVVREQHASEQFLPAVPVMAGDEMWAGGDKVWLELELGRQEEVVAEELVVEAEDTEVLEGSDSPEQRRGEEGLQRELFAGEQFVPHRQSLRQEQGVAQEAEAETEGHVKQPEEKPGAQGLTEPGNGGNCPWSPRKLLEALQLEMEPMNMQASSAFLRIKKRMCQRQKPYLKQRSSTLQCIRGFWAKAVSLMACVTDRSQCAWASAAGKYQGGYLRKNKIDTLEKS